jgi:formylglycine-generating enzyme required for sulfatase activity
VLLADEGGVSPWQRAELSLARSLPRTPRLVQVLLPGAADDAYSLAFGQALADSPLIDLRQGLDDRGALGVLLAALRPGAESERAETTVTGTTDGACPFPGAAAFGESDAPLFNARGHALEELRTALQTSRRVLLQGPAGCGKTSLVMAGLWPALRQAGHGALHLVDLRRSEGRPWSREAAALGSDALLVVDHADEGSRADQVKLAALCKDDAGPALLVVWRGAPLALAEADQLTGWKEAPARAATLREHALHHGGPPGARAMLAEALAPLRRVDLPALDARALRASVDAMLAQAGRRAETGLLERLFAELGELPSMAVVQRTLAALWPLQARGWLTNEAYERIGGVDRLVCQALEALHAPTDGVERAALDALLQRLVHSSADGTSVSRTMDWSRECSLPACEGRAAAAAQRLAQAGLLSVRAELDPGADAATGPATHAAIATIHLRLAHLPRRCTLLEARSAPPSVARVHVIARAYAAWADGASDDAADAVIEDTDLGPLRPSLSHGEAAYATALQALRRRETRRRRMVAASLAGCVVVAVAVGIWRTRSAQADAAAQAQAASAAVATADVAREQVKRVQEAPADPTAPALRPTPGTPTRVVVHRSGDGPEDAALARALVDALPADRFTVDRDIEAVSLEICGDVRFHQPQDVDRARDALDRLNQALAGRGDVRRLELNDRSQTRGALPSRAGTIEVWLPPMSRAPMARRDRWGESRLVPAGCAVVGSDAKGRESLRRALQAATLPFYDSELPLRRIWLPAYYIGRHEVTMAQFAAYQQACERQATACPPWRPRYVDPVKEPERPAVFVSWTQADAYCRWAGGRLPSELLWEKAARGNDGRFWPWGEQPDDGRYQGRAQARRQPVAVGSFPAGDSPYGVADLAGNVWELTADSWQGEGSGHTIRGGSYLNSLMESRASVRWATGAEDTGSEYLGFRCVASADR